jgi:hypothetical protein
MLKNISRPHESVLSNIIFVYKKRVFELFLLALCILFLSLYMQSSFAHGVSSDTSTQDNVSEIKYKIQSNGTQYLDSKKSDVAIKVLVEESNLGSAELEVAEIFLPAGACC